MAERAWLTVCWLHMRRQFFRCSCGDDGLERDADAIRTGLEGPAEPGDPGA